MKEKVILNNNTLSGCGAKPCCASQFKKLVAFSLAEVLITMGIIGVVAATVMPTLISNVEQTSNIAAWKKQYAALSQAVRMMQTEGATWGDYDANAMRDAFIKHLNVAKSCDMDNSTCWSGVGSYTNGTSYNYNKSVIVDITLESGHKASVTLIDGTNIAFYAHSGNAIGNSWILVDVNGMKGPNSLGRDVFGLRVYLTNYTTKSFEYTEMGKCNPPIAGVTGNYLLGLGCSYYYLYDK